MTDMFMLTVFSPTMEPVARQKACWGSMGVEQAVDIFESVKLCRQNANAGLTQFMDCMTEKGRKFKRTKTIETTEHASTNIGLVRRHTYGPVFSEYLNVNVLILVQTQGG